MIPSQGPNRERDNTVKSCKYGPVGSLSYILPVLSRYYLRIHGSTVSRLEFGPSSKRAMLGFISVEITSLKSHQTCKHTFDKQPTPEHKTPLKQTRTNSHRRELTRETKQRNKHPSPKNLAKELEGFIISGGTKEPKRWPLDFYSKIQ